MACFLGVLGHRSKKLLEINCLLQIHCQTKCLSHSTSSTYSMSCLLYLHPPYLLKSLHRLNISLNFYKDALKEFFTHQGLTKRESWFIKSVDIMENCHCHQGGEGETRGILRTKWSRRWDLHFSWLQLAEKPQPHSLANASEKRHFSSYFDYFKTVLLSTCCMTTDNNFRSNFCRVILILWQLMRAGSVG